MLTNTHHDKLTEYHVELATKILKEKCVIGLTEDYENSIRRFQQFFAWKRFNHTVGCVNRFVHLNPINKFAYDLYNVTILSEERPEWEILKEREKYDLQLYKNAKELYDLQGSIIFERLERFKIIS